MPPLRFGHLAPFLAELASRSKVTQRDVAFVCGISQGALSKRMTSPHGLSPSTTLAVAKAFGATPAELERAAALDAMDRGSIPLSHDVSEEAVSRAMAALRGAA